MSSVILNIHFYFIHLSLLIEILLAFTYYTSSDRKTEVYFSPFHLAAAFLNMFLSVSVSFRLQLCVLLQLASTASAFHQPTSLSRIISQHHHHSCLESIVGSILLLLGADANRIQISLYSLSAKEFCQYCIIKYNLLY